MVISPYRRLFSVKRKVRGLWAVAQFRFILLHGHIIEALRLIYVKGSTFTELLPQFYILIGFATFTSTWAIVSYRKNS